jgi:hypothetical protein
MRKNLFDTRGGVAMIGHCEECNDAIPEDSASGLCPSCETEWEVCDDDE